MIALCSAKFGIALELVGNLYGFALHLARFCFPPRRRRWTSINKARCKFTFLRPQPGGSQGGSPCCHGLCSHGRRPLIYKRCVAEEVGRAFIHRKLGVEALAIRRPRSQAIGTPDTVPRNAADKLSRGRSLLVSVANKPWLALPNLSIIHAVWIKIARGRIRHTLDRRVFVCLGFFLNIRLHIMRKKKRE